MWSVIKLGGIHKIFEFITTNPKTYMWKYRVNQYLIVLNLYSVSIITILGTEFITVKDSQNLNLMYTGFQK